MAIIPKDYFLTAARMARPAFDAVPVAKVEAGERLTLDKIREAWSRASELPLAHDPMFDPAYRGLDGDGNEVRDRVPIPLAPASPSSSATPAAEARENLIKGEIGRIDGFRFVSEARHFISYEPMTAELRDGDLSGIEDEDDGEAEVDEDCEDVFIDAKPGLNVEIHNSAATAPLRIDFAGVTFVIEPGRMFVIKNGEATVRGIGEQPPEPDPKRAAGRAIAAAVRANGEVTSK